MFTLIAADRVRGGGWLFGRPSPHQNLLLRRIRTHCPLIGFLREHRPSPHSHRSRAGKPFPQREKRSSSDLDLLCPLCATWSRLPYPWLYSPICGSESGHSSSSSMRMPTLCRRCRRLSSLRTIYVSISAFRARIIGCRRKHWISYLPRWDFDAW